MELAVVAARGEGEVEQGREEREGREERNLEGRGRRTCHDGVFGDRQVGKTDLGTPGDVRLDFFVVRLERMENVSAKASVKGKKGGGG